MNRLKKILFITIGILFLCGHSALAATLYLKTGSTTWTAAGSWSAVSAAGGDNAGPPTTADDAIAELLSGNVTIDTGAVARSFNTTSGTGSYGGVITHTAGVTLTLGDGTAGVGNIAFKLNSGLTYNLGSTTTSVVSFVSTSGTQQNVDFSTKTMGGVTFNGAGGSWIFDNALTTVGSLTLTNGTLNTNGKACTIGAFAGGTAGTKVLTLGATTMTITTATGWNLTSANTTLTANTSTITLSAASAPAIFGGKTTYNIFQFTGGGLIQTTGAATIATLTVTGTASLTDAFFPLSTITIGTALNINGNSPSNRLFIRGDTYGTARTFTLGASTVTASNVDFRDVTFSVATDLSGISGGSGNAGGNTGITFTTGATKYWVGNGGNWSDATNHWATSSNGSPNAANTPLPQDSVIFDGSSFSSSSQTVTADMPRLCTNITWTNATNSPTFSLTSLSNALYGSLTLISAMTFTMNQTLTLEGRSVTATLTSAGQTFGAGITMQMIGSTLTLQDALITTGTLNLSFGSFLANGMNVTVSTFTTSNSNVRTLTLGSGTWTITGTGASAFNINTTTNLTFTSTGSTISLTNAASGSKTFSGGGLTFNNFSTSGGGTGAVIIIGSNTFAAFTVSSKTVNFTAATTQTVTSFSATNATLQSVTGGSAWNITDGAGTNTATGGTVKDSTAAGGATWNAINSIDGTGNTNWNFSAVAGKAIIIN